MRSDLIKTGDWLLIIFFLFLSGFWLWSTWRKKESPEECVVQWQEGTLTFTLPKDTVLILTGPIGKTIVEIKGRGARIRDSDCPHKVCVKMGRAEMGGQMVVCAPNRVVVMLKGRGGVDAITR